MPNVEPTSLISFSTDLLHAVKFPCLVEISHISAAHSTRCFWSEHTHSRDVSAFAGLAIVHYGSSFLACFYPRTSILFIG